MRKQWLGSLVGMLLAGAAGAGPVPPPYYLVGAQLYSCSADGTNGGPGAYSEFYQYSTNTATAHGTLSVNGAGGSIAFPLAEGSNGFTFATGGIDPGDYGCLNLFFDDAMLSFNPPYDANLPIPGDLTVIAPIGGSGFAYPAAGIDVQSYNTTSLSVVATEYSGATAFAIAAGPEIRVTGFTVGPSIDGSFEIQVPEASAVAAGLECLVALGLLARVRRRPAARARATIALRCDGSSLRSSSS